MAPGLTALARTARGLVAPALPAAAGRGGIFAADAHVHLSDLATPGIEGLLQSAKGFGAMDFLHTGTPAGPGLMAAWNSPPPPKKEVTSRSAWAPWHT